MTHNVILLCWYSMIKILLIHDHPCNWLILLLCWGGGVVDFRDLYLRASVTQTGQWTPIVTFGCVYPEGLVSRCWTLHAVSIWNKPQRVCPSMHLFSSAYHWEGSQGVPRPAEGVSCPRVFLYLTQERPTRHPRKVISASCIQSCSFSHYLKAYDHKWG